MVSVRNPLRSARYCVGSAKCQPIKSICARPAVVMVTDSSQSMTSVPSGYCKRGTGSRMRIEICCPSCVMRWRHDLKVLDGFIVIRVTRKDRGAGGMRKAVRVGDGQGHPAKAGGKVGVDVGACFRGTQDKFAVANIPKIAGDGSAIGHRHTVAAVKGNGMRLAIPCMPIVAAKPGRISATGGG